MVQKTAWELAKETYISLLQGRYGTIAMEKIKQIAGSLYLEIFLFTYLSKEEPDFEKVAVNFGLTREEFLDFLEIARITFHNLFDDILTGYSEVGLYKPSVDKKRIFERYPKLYRKAAWLVPLHWGEHWTNEVYNFNGDGSKPIRVRSFGWNMEEELAGVKIGEKEIVNLASLGVLASELERSPKKKSWQSDGYEEGGLVMSQGENTLDTKTVEFLAFFKLKQDPDGEVVNLKRLYAEFSDGQYDPNFLTEIKKRGLIVQVGKQGTAGIFRLNDGEDQASIFRETEGRNLEAAVGFIKYLLENFPAGQPNDGLYTVYRRFNGDGNQQLVTLLIKEGYVEKVSQGEYRVSQKGKDLIGWAGKTVEEETTSKPVPSFDLSDPEMPEKVSAKKISRIRSVKGFLRFILERYGDDLFKVGLNKLYKEFKGNLNGVLVRSVIEDDYIETVKGEYKVTQKGKDFAEWSGQASAVSDQDSNEDLDSAYPDYLVRRIGPAKDFMTFLLKEYGSSQISESIYRLCKPFDTGNRMVDVLKKAGFLEVLPNLDYKITEKGRAFVGWEKSQEDLSSDLSNSDPVGMTEEKIVLPNSPEGIQTFEDTEMPEEGTEPLEAGCLPDLAVTNSNGSSHSENGELSVPDLQLDPNMKVSDLIDLLYKKRDQIMRETKELQDKIQELQLSQGKIGQQIHLLEDAIKITVSL